MRIRNRANVRTRGGVLLSMLVFAGIIAMFLAGVATLSVSHFNRAEVEGRRAAAIQFADAGINYELRWISENPADPLRPHQAYPGNGQNSAYTGSISGATGSYTVKVMNTDGSGPWMAPNDALIQSTGTVDGVSRTVQIIAEKKGIFEEYALYSTNSTTISGSNSSVIGNFGTNGSLTVNGNQGSGAINGTVTFNGSTPIGGNNVNSTGNAIQWPTVDQIANLAFPSGGLTWLRTHSNNNNLKQFSSSDGTYSIANAVAVNLTMNNYVFNQQAVPGNTTTDQNVDDAAGGTRYANQYEGLKGKKVIIFPPGDYYFERLNFSNGGGIGWLIDNAAGRVRIWVNSGNNQNDSLDNTVVFTSTDPAKFRLYYNKCQELSIMGNSTFYGGIYAVRSDCQTSVQIGGNSSLYGGLIGNNITLSGGSHVIFPNNGGGSSDDFAAWFGFRNTWKEINPNGGPVFVDGRTN